MSFFEAVAVAAVGVVAPGVAGVLQPGTQRAPFVALRFLAGAALLGFASLVVRRVLQIPAEPVAYGAVVLALSIAAGVVGVRRGGSWPQMSRAPIAAGLAVVAFALAAWAGLGVVPPLEDQDMEVQGTAYGLVTELQPFCLTNRGTLYFFAHPPLLHIVNATTLTLAGDLDAVRPAYDAAVAERAKLAPEQLRPSVSRAIRAFTQPEPRPDRTLEWARTVYGGFTRDPALLGTRAPNFVFAALLAALTCAVLRAVGAGKMDAALLSLVQATLPEIFVRSGYGGYFALSAATFLAAAWLAVLGASRASFAAGALAMLTNQKSVIVGAASLVLGFARARPLLLGMIAGGVLFAAWGLSIAPEEFVSDHLREHGVSRFLEVGGAASPGAQGSAGPSAAQGSAASSSAAAPTYLSRIGLWSEFARHYGPGWCLAVAFAFAATGRRVLRRRSASEADGLLAIAWVWAILGMLLFTWTDWRQTKHLAKLVPAMTIVLGALLAGMVPRARLLLRIALGFSLAWNVVWIVRLARDFTAISPTPLW